LLRPQHLGQQIAGGGSTPSINVPGTTSAPSTGAQQLATMRSNPDFTSDLTASLSRAGRTRRYV